MALKIQIVIMDSKDYIIEFMDFKPTDKNGILTYVWQHIINSSATKIHIRKWD